jgi:hypothetical protein
MVLDPAHEDQATELVLCGLQNRRNVAVVALVVKTYRDPKHCPTANAFPGAASGLTDSPAL